MNSIPTSNHSDSAKVALKPEAVALDMDGLLFDTERIYWEVSDTMLKRRGFRFSEALQQRMMGRVGSAALEQMNEFHCLNEDAEALLEESNELYGRLLPTLIRPMPGLEAFVDLLQKGSRPFALTTSSQRQWVDIIFADQPWRDSLAFILTGDDVTNGKPHPEMYLTAADRFGLSASRMLVLEDSGNGCAAAVAAGAMVVAIPNEHTRRQDFSGVALIAESLADPRLRDLLS